MKILFNDLIQNSDAPATLKSPALADILTDDAFVITLDSSGTVNCIGVGYTDATEITVNGETVTFSDTGNYLNGLYILDTPITGTTLTISHDGTFMGRFAAGEYVELGASQSQEPGFYSTSEPRTTLSGQTVEGAGGIAGREQQVDVKYKLTRVGMTNFEEGHRTQISKGFPVFVIFDIEYNLGNGRFLWPRLYGRLPKDLTFQSSVNKALFSRKFKFREAF